MGDLDGSGGGGGGVGGGSSGLAYGMGLHDELFPIEAEQSKWEKVRSVSQPLVSLKEHA